METQYKYKVVMSEKTKITGIEKELNENGLDGWKLVNINIIQTPYRIMLTFMKKI